MSEKRKAHPEVQPEAERRRFSAEYKRRIVIEAERCQHGESGALLRREGLSYAQIGKWRTAHAEGTLGKKRGPVANPDRAEMRRLEAENARLKRELERAGHIIAAKKSWHTCWTRSNRERTGAPNRRETRLLPPRAPAASITRGAMPA